MVRKTPRKFEKSAENDHLWCKKQRIGVGMRIAVGICTVGGVDAGEGGGDMEDIPEWERRERHLHPELEWAEFRPHYLAYFKHCKLNDGAAFTVRHDAGGRPRYALSARERSMWHRTQAELRAVAQEHERRWPAGGGTQAGGARRAADVDRANILETGVKRTRANELYEEMFPYVDMSLPCPLAPLVGQRGVRRGQKRKDEGGLPSDDMG